MGKDFIKKGRLVDEESPPKPEMVKLNSKMHRKTFNLPKIRMSVDDAFQTEAIVPTEFDAKTTSRPRNSDYLFDPNNHLLNFQTIDYRS